jgi:hypothetical protein
MIIWTPYESSCLNEIGWDAGTLTLGIAFDERGTYLFFLVPNDIYLSFIGAGSKGAFFNESIRTGGYSYQKIAP